MNYVNYQLIMDARITTYSIDCGKILLIKSMDNLSIGLLTSARADDKTCVAVCFAELKHQKCLITNGLFLGPGTKSLAVLCENLSNLKDLVRYPLLDNETLTISQKKSLIKIMRRKLCGYPFFLNLQKILLFTILSMMKVFPYTFCDRLLVDIR